MTLRQTTLIALEQQTYVCLQVKNSAHYDGMRLVKLDDWARHNALAITWCRVGVVAPSVKTKRMTKHTYAVPVDNLSYCSILILNGGHCVVGWFAGRDMIGLSCALGNEIN